MPFVARDSGVFLYIGWRILNGEIPYRDVWDHKGPVIYYLDALGLWLSPNNTWGVWGIEFLFLFAAGLISFIVLQKIFGPFPALAGLYLWLFSFFITFAGGNLTTEYTIVFQFLLLYLIYLNRNTSRALHFFILGFISALTFFTRQNGVGLLVAYVIYLFFHAVGNKSYRELLSQYSRIFIGFLAVTLPVVIYFAFHNALFQFWDAAFVYNYFYSAARDTSDRWFAIQSGYQWLSQTGIAQLTLAGWILALVWLVRERHSEQFPRAFLWTTVIALPVELLFVSIGGRPRIPYFLSLLPVCAVLSTFSFWALGTLLKKLRFSTPLLAGLVIILTGLVIVIQAPLYINAAKGYRHFVDPFGVAQYIQENSNPNDYVLMLGAETAVNFFARRASPTRYVYQYPLYYKDYAGVDMLAQFFQDILDNKPKFIVVTTGGAIIQRSFSENRTDTTDEMANLVRSMYTKKVRMGEWVILEYRTK